MRQEVNKKYVKILYYILTLLLIMLAYFGGKWKEEWIGLSLLALIIIEYRTQIITKEWKKSLSQTQSYFNCYLSTARDTPKSSHTQALADSNSSSSSVSDREIFHTSKHKLATGSMRSLSRDSKSSPNTSSSGSPNIPSDVWSTIENSDPYEFERIIEKLFQALGYRVKRTKKSGDAGLDVLAYQDSLYLGIQAKRYAPGNKISSPEVQSAIGAAVQEGCNVVVLVTTSEFTEPAKTAALETRQKGIEVTLINGDELMKLLIKAQLL